ncbi:6,7-dimethyl-8-ribityllumazine synthase [Lactobacillus sp. CC-MHH1034]|uniref:6,7-dimethyl-8-ribityllumazine synthase n=1 Tax=Agrilactobacillus fermenti TaxID=2586909 RepID=UPI001E48833C|nr:6,7-dimethyl-8-ribityllumazine synthase [Agrilactobacillus fermenti]MCD2256362.1 6,7-dimethyl-8-ribityllumazine synthase [Agrilactobacillus fermenti]
MGKIKGLINGQGKHIAIVVAKFNELVTRRLLDGAMDTLQQCGVAETDITVVWVPGAFEIPRITRLISQKPEFDGIITLGAIVRGETTHFDYVCSETASGVAQVSLNSPIPVLFGVLTTNNMAQALNRAGGKVGNKGSECAIGVLEMIDVQKKIG